MTGFLEAGTAVGFATGGRSTTPGLRSGQTGDGGGSSPAAPTGTTTGRWRRGSDPDSARRRRAARPRALRRIGARWLVADLSARGVPVVDAYLAIGPGGLFALVERGHGRSRLRMAGDIIQVDGRRPAHVAEARVAARLSSQAISWVAGTEIPVVPVLVLTGSGALDINGLPRDVVVATGREVRRILGGYGERITDVTVAKLAAIAQHPVTWTSEVRLAAGQSW